MRVVVFFKVVCKVLHESAVYSYFFQKVKLLIANRISSTADHLLPAAAVNTGSTYSTSVSFLLP